MPGVEVTAHERRVNPGVQRRGIECDQATLGVTCDANGEWRVPGGGCGEVIGPLAGKEIRGGEHLLDFVADNVAAQFEGGAIDPLAVGLVGETRKRRAARPGILAINQHRHEDLATVLGQAPGELAFGRQPWRQTGDLLRRLVRVWNGDDPGNGRRLWPKPKALPGNALEHRPAHRLRRKGRHGPRSAEPQLCAGLLEA